MNLPEPLQPYGHQFSYILLDFSPTSETEIIGHIYLQARLRLKGYILDERLGAHWDEILGLRLGLQEAKTALEHLKVMIQYLLGGSKAERREAIINKINQNITGAKLMLVKRKGY